MNYVACYARKGFTLVELMIVVSVLAILAAITLPTFSNAKEKATAASAATSMKAIASAIYQYRNDTGEWPNDRSWGQKPSELETYLPTVDFGNTPIGGAWDFDRSSSSFKTASGTRVVVGITIWDGNVDQYAEVDRLLDDGDLATGQVQLITAFAQRLVFIVEALE